MMTVMPFSFAMRRRIASSSSLWRISRKEVGSSRMMTSGSLTDRTRKKHPLALAVADGVEIAAAELFGMNGAHRLLDLLLILAGQHAEPSGCNG